MWHARLAPLVAASFLLGCSDRTPDLDLGSAAESLEEQGESKFAGDRIGVVFRDAIESESTQKLLKTLGVQTLDTYGPWLATVALEKSLMPVEIWQLAGELTANYPEIQQAGVVELLDPGGPRKPPPMQVWTDRVIAQFASDFTKEQMTTLAAELGLELVAQYPFTFGQYLVRVAPGVDPRAAIDALLQRGAIFAHSNYLLHIEDRHVFPGDPLFFQQYHHFNFGQERGVLDADIDSTRAWDFGAGVVEWPTVAVIEYGGMDPEHPDYAANVVDTRSFRTCVDDSDPSCATATLEGDWRGWGAHGTNVAGLVAAADNDIGVVGGCPDCKLILIENATDTWGTAMALDYAAQAGADIITNSWGFSSSVAIPDSVRAAVQRVVNDGRDGVGTTVLFALPSVGNYSERCSGRDADLSSLPEVIGVGVSNNWDRVGVAGYGDCMDVIAPADNGGTLGIVTTDMRGSRGTNDSFLPCGGGDLSDQDYTKCFGGTSAATPIVAGAAALALAEMPELTPLRLQRLLQDTADKIQPELAAYDPFTGFGTASSSPDPSDPDLPVGTRHAFGRINAYDAVRIVANRPLSGGNGGVDVFMRDNELDWGNQEQPSNKMFDRERSRIPHWESMDIKVDAPFYGPAPTPQTFDAFPDEAPIAGKVNRVYVRLRSRGPNPATGTSLRLYYTRAAAALPALPFGFWRSLPADLRGVWSSARQTLPTGTFPVAYSGASVAGTDEDGARIVRFEFTAPPHDPEGTNHFCLFAVADTAQDRYLGLTYDDLSADAATIVDNNVSLRNYTLVPAWPWLFPYASSFILNNIFDFSTTMRLSADLPEGLKLTVGGVKLGQPFTMKPGEKRLIKVEISASQAKANPGTLRFWQERLDESGLKAEVVGGISYRFAPTTK
ncbi:MAG TPA: S8 family serine peptidase [Polyangiaceae bacterium]|nr:S8 family serine peptidase [Polyangiaceae bacterium]